MINKSGDASLNAAAVKFVQELQKYPIEVGVGIGVIIPNLVNGCSWGFVGDDNKVFLNYIEAVNNNPNMACFKIKGGYLVTMNMDYLLSILSKIAGGYVTNKDLQIASKHRQKALVDLEKFMTKGGQGRIGIYNLNDSPRITVQGVSYPAFCVTMADLLAICVRNGYGLKLGNAVRTPGQVSKHVIQVVERLNIAPSGNALFIDIVKMG